MHGRLLIVAAHPDDEAIGAGGLLIRRRSGSVLHLTDGGPRDSTLRAGLPSSREDYVRLRDCERRTALEVAGLPGGGLHSLGAVDQELQHALIPHARATASLILTLAPEVVLTHPYEGGHPDHDATAFLTRAAVELACRAGLRRPWVIEMTSYHLEHSNLCTGHFLGDAGEQLKLALTPEERERKARMFAAYASQAQVLSRFTVGDERFRLAPAYDFTRRPHPGSTWYECLGWSARADALCARMSAAWAELGLGGTSC